MSPILTHLTYYLAIVGGLIAAIFMGSWLGSENYGTVILSVLILLAAFWILLSGEGWWVPMMFALGIGGFFTVPFKLYPHEMALAICGVALLPRIPLKASGLRKLRPRLSNAFLALLAYLLVHVSVGAFNYWNHPGLGNIGRAYLNALWPLLFGLGYYYYGSIKLMRPALRFLYAALLIRMSMGFLNYFTDDVFFVPGVNYTIDPQDLRSSGYMLLFLSGLMLVTTDSPIAKVWHGFTFVVSAYAWLLGGSRAQVAGVLILAFILLIIFRKWFQITIAVTVVAILVALLNVSPTIIEPLPYRMQRGLSVLIVGSTPQVDVQMDIRGSDQFREVISNEGLVRWTSSWQTMFVGVGIRPFDENATFMASRFEVDAFTLMVQSSADVGAYETGLWTVLAVTGGVGFLLYAWLLVSFSREIVRAIRAGHLRGGELVICAWAGCSLIGWFFTCYLYGGFPSFELFLGFIAMAVVEDRRRQLAQVEPNTPEQIAPPSPGKRVRPGREPVLAGV